MLEGEGEITEVLKGLEEIDLLEKSGVLGSGDLDGEYSGYLLAFPVREALSSLFCADRRSPSLSPQLITTSSLVSTNFFPPIRRL